MLTENDLQNFESLLKGGPDSAWREREAIERLIEEIRRLWQERDRTASS